MFQFVVSWRSQFLLHQLGRVVPVVGRVMVLVVVVGRVMVLVPVVVVA